MTNSNNSSMEPSVPRAILFGSIILALAGFLDATYLTVEHFTNAIPPCSVGGCEQVLTSPYASMLGVPVALIGLIFYAAILLLCMAYSTTRDIRLFHIVAYFSVIGFVGSIWFVFAQIVLIHAICPYCLVSEALSTGLFFLGAKVLQLKSEQPGNGGGL